MARECEDIQTKVGLNSPQPGTTFPPGRCSLQQFDELVAKAAKCRSESDLVSAWLLRNRHFDDDDDEHALEASKANSGRARGVASSDQDGKDSDLFFDFDIVPEREDEDGDRLKVGDYKDAATGNVATDTSEEAEEAAAAVAAGAEDVPLAWDQMQLQTGSAERSSPTAVSPSGKPRNESPLVSPDSLLEEPMPDLLLEAEEATADAKAGSTSSGDEDDEDESPLTFVKGDCRHTVASSTLSSLVAMLEKESPRSKGRDCGGGSTGGATGAWGMGRYRSELPTIAASPAATSFFPVATDHEGDFQQRTAPRFGLRADSMPCLHKDREQLKKNAPKEQERSENVEPERQRSEKKAKMRRASSLKAAKSTGSPCVGRKLSVR